MDTLGNIYVSDTSNARIRSIQTTSLCVGGYYIDRTAGCVPVPAGYYSIGTGMYYACAAGSYSSSNSAACTACAANSYSTVASAVCVSCAAGQWSDAGATECIALPTPSPTIPPTLLPTFQPTTATPAAAPTAGVVSSCSPGYYLSPGGGSCHQCKAGTYSPGNFSASCLPAPAVWFNFLYF